MSEEPQSNNKKINIISMSINKKIAHYFGLFSI